MQPLLYSEQPYALLPRSRVPLPQSGQLGTVSLEEDEMVISYFFVRLSFAGDCEFVSDVRLVRVLRSFLAGSAAGCSIVIARPL